MFGYTPPLIVAIDGALLRDCAGFQQVAVALESQLLRQPLWAVVHAPADLPDEDPEAMRDAVEALLTDPRIPVHPFEGPRYTPAAWRERATARVLQAHLEDVAVHLPEVVARPGEPLPRHPAAILPAAILRDEEGRFHLRDAPPLAAAIQVAEELGSRSVQVWCRPEDACAFLLPQELADHAHFAGIEVEAVVPRLVGPVPALWP